MPREGEGFAGHLVKAPPCDETLCNNSVKHYWAHLDGPVPVKMHSLHSEPAVAESTFIDCLLPPFSLVCYRMAQIRIDLSSVNSYMLLKSALFWNGLRSQTLILISNVFKTSTWPCFSNYLHLSPKRWQSSHWLSIPCRKDLTNVFGAVGPLSLGGFTLKH